MTIDQIVNAYATAKICGIDISIAEIEELYPKYIQEAFEEYNKLHNPDGDVLAKCDATPRTW